MLMQWDRMNAPSPDYRALRPENVFWAIWTHENLTERHACCTCHMENHCLVTPPLSKALPDSLVIPQYPKHVAGMTAEAGPERDLKRWLDPVEMSL